MGVSHTSVYNKIDGIEPDVSAPLVRYSARQLAPVIEQLGGKKPDEGTRQIFSRPRAGQDADLRNTSIFSNNSCSAPPLIKRFPLITQHREIKSRVNQV